MNFIWSQFGRIRIQVVFRGSDQGFSQMSDPGESLLNILAVNVSFFIFIEAKVLNERVCPSVTNSITRSQTLFCLPYIIHNKSSHSYFRVTQLEFLFENTFHIL